MYFCYKHFFFLHLAYSLQEFIYFTVSAKCLQDTHDLYFTCCIILFLHLFLSLSLSLSSRPLDCAEAQDVLQRCEHVLEVLDQRDEEMFLEWTEGLEEICETHLKEPLLALDSETGFFQVNFSPAVSPKTIDF